MAVYRLADWGSKTHRCLRPVVDVQRAFTQNEDIEYGHEYVGQVQVVGVDCLSTIDLEL